MEVFRPLLLLMGVLATGNCVSDSQTYSPENNTDGAMTTIETEITLPCDEPGGVQSLEINANSRATLTVNLTEPSSQRNHCNFKTYNLLYKLVRHKACKVDEVDQNTRTMDNIRSGRYLLEYLEDFADYEVSVYAIVRDGTRNLQGPVTTMTGSTLSNVPSAAPNVSVDDERSSSRSLFFTWEPVPCKHLNGEFVNYRFTINDTRRQNGFIKDQSINAQEISQLLPCTFYKFTLRVRNSYRNGPTVEMVGKTKTEHPGGVRDLRIDSGYRSTLGVTWNAPSSQGNHCSVERYNLVYKLVRHKACKANEVDQNNITMNDVRSGIYLGDLEDYADYKVSVYAIVADGSRDLEGPVTTGTATTALNEPSSAPVLSVDTERSTSRSLVFTWEPVSCKDLNGQFQYYRFSINGTTGGNGLIRDQNINKKGISHLLPCTFYEFTLRVRNNYWEGPIGEVVGRTKLEQPGRVQNLRIYSGRRRATLGVYWIAPSRRSNPCNIKMYNLLYKLVRHRACEVNEADQTNRTMTNVRSVEYLRNLEDYAQYEVSVYAIATDGSRDLEGPVATATESTPSNEPSSAPNVSVDYERSSSRSLYFTWEPVPCAGLNGEFQYYFITSNGTSRNTETIRYQNANRKEISHLMPCTLYEFTIRVANDFGEGPVGRAFGKTKKEQPEAVRNLVVYPYGPARLKITWDPPSRQNNPCNVKSYTLLYKLVRHKACGEDEDDQNNRKINNVRSGKFLRDLEDYADYEVSVYAIVRNGSRDLGGPVTTKRAITSSKAPSFAPVVSVDYERSTSTSLVFTWESVPCKRLNGIFQYYQFTINGTTRNPAGRITGKETNTKEILNLLPCTWYEFSLRVVNNIGEGPIGRAVGITTKEPPGKVGNLLINAVGPATLRVTWTVPSRQSNLCNVNRYNLLYKLVRHKACEDEVDQNNRTINNVRSGRYLRNLEYYADYEVSVYAIVRDGTNSLQGPVATKMATTSSNAPSSAPDVSVDNERSTSRTLVFTWDSVPCESLNGVFRHYFLTNNGTSQQSETIINPAINSKEIPQLVPCTLYEFTLRVVNDFGEGPIGRAVGKTKKERPGKNFNIRLQSTEPRSISARWTRPHRHPCTISSQTISIEMIDTGGCAKSSHSNESIPLSSNVFLYRFNDLTPNTLYKISLRAENSKGYGGVSSQEKRTGESYPPQLPKPELLSFDASVIRISWEIPDPPHGIILNYDISVQPVGYLSRDSLELITVNTSGSCEPPTASVPGLQPNTYYSLQVRARTMVGPGNWSEPLTIRTAEGRPGQPSAVQITQITHSTLTIEWDVPIKPNGRITKYEISYRALEGLDDDGVNVVQHVSNNNETYLKHIVYEISSLEPSTMYEIEISAYTSAGKGDIVVLRNSTIQDLTAIATRQSSGVWITLLLTLLGLLLVGFLIVVYRRKKNKENTWPMSYGRRASEFARRTEEQGTANLEETNREEIELETNPSNSQGKRNAAKPPLPAKPHKNIVRITDLAAYVKSKKSNEEDNFISEHECLPDSSLYPSDVALKPENKKKNRYGNIIPYDRSRVILDVINDDPHSDYINASYINGYNCQNKYIASHGPNKASVNDFWRMVWQEDVGKIVMLTNIVEVGKQKCEKYWPDETSKYGNVMVTLKEENKYTYYIVRTFKLKLVDTRRTKVVKHFHFTAWPDMSVPDTAGPILDLLQCVRSQESHSKGPIVVHCSAGVGRTGTFITLDAMLDMAAAENRINVYYFVCQMRQSRMKMVQVGEQYEFIFDVLVEYFVIGNTSIQVDKFRLDLTKLKTINEETGRSYLQEEFEKLDLTSITPSESNLRGGRARDNLQKNRFPDCIPVDTYRPYLMTDVGDLGNNYINASFLNGYRKKDMFLGTQMPLENTVIDFLRMVWDYNSNFIVMLNDMNPQNEAQYWSDSGVFCRGPFTVKQLSCEDISNIRFRKLRIIISSQNQSRTIQHIQCLNLPITATNYEISATLVQVINELRREEIETEEGPITVHCVNGVGRTGLFCSLLSSLDQAKTEGQVNVFQHVNKLRRSRPNMVETLDEYECIFDTVLMYLEQCDVYENISR